MTRRASTPIVLLLLLVVAAACKKVEDLTPHREQAMGLVAKYGPQLNELITKSDGLAARVKALPVAIPGADRATELLARHKGSLTSLRGMLDALPVKAAAAKSKPALEKLVSETTAAMTDGITNAGRELATAEADVAKLEAAAVAPPPAPATVAFTSKLSTGFELSGAAGDGIEAALLGFVSDAGKAIDKTTWFDFDRLTFESGGSSLDMEKSAEQLENIAEILKAFPAVTLKIGGYTDSTGAADRNKKLAQERAETVMQALVTMGVDASRLAAEGYGAEFPVCAANDTEECKAQNRRIAVRVTAK